MPTNNRLIEFLLVVIAVALGLVVYLLYLIYQVIGPHAL